jgi:hypothetical protein
MISSLLLLQIVIIYLGIPLSILYWLLAPDLFGYLLALVLPIVSLGYLLADKILLSLIGARVLSTSNASINAIAKNLAFVHLSTPVKIYTYRGHFSDFIFLKSFSRKSLILDEKLLEQMTEDETVSLLEYLSGQIAPQLNSLIMFCLLISMLKIVLIEYLLKFLQVIKVSSDFKRAVLYLGSMILLSMNSLLLFPIQRKLSKLNSDEFYLRSLRGKMALPSETSSYSDQLASLIRLIDHPSKSAKRAIFDLGISGIKYLG